MLDLESELRRVLAARSASVPVEREVPPPVLARARRRRSTHAATRVGLVVVVVLATTLAVARHQEAEDTRVVAGPSPTSVPAATLSPLQGAPLRDTLALTGSPPSSSQPCRSVCPAPAPTRLVDLSVSPATELARLPGPLLAEATPVRTASGVLVLTGDYQDGILWLVAAGNSEPVRLAERVAGFAVAADRRTVAWSTQVGIVGSPRAESVLVTARLPDADVLHRTTYAGFARVVGFAGDVVLLDTGDGAASGAATWVPERDRVVRARGFGTVGASDPARSQAVLGEGDGPCGVLVAVRPDGSVAAVNDTWARLLGCHVQRAFSPDGALLATAVDGQMAPGGSEGSALLVQSTADGGERLRIAFARVPSQVSWLDTQTVLVVTRSGEEHYVERCSLQTRSCRTDWEIEAGLVLLVGGR